MVKIKKIIFCFLLVSCISNKGFVQENQLFVNVVEAYVFSSFDKAGTTASIRASYSELKNKSPNKQKLSDTQLNELNIILKEVKWNRHYQKKITGIERGIMLCDSNNCYGLILTRNRLIDFGRNYECDLTYEMYIILSRLFLLQEH